MNFQSLHLRWQRRDNVATALIERDPSGGRGGTARGIRRLHGLVPTVQGIRHFAGLSSGEVKENPRDLLTLKDFSIFSIQIFNFF